MSLPLKRSKAASGLVASASSYEGKSSSGYAQRSTLPWQDRTLTYIDLVPELAFSSRFYAKMLRPLRIYPGTLLPDQTTEPIKEGLPVEMLKCIKGKDGTTKPILASYGRLMFSTGEGILLGVDIDTPTEYWSFVWNNEVEVKKRGDTIEKIIWRPMGGGGEPREYTSSQARAYRFWMPHPRLSGESDSPMRSVLEVAEELIALTASVRATATSRTVQGILLMPQELAPPPAEVDGDEDPEVDVFVSEMVEHLESQKENAGSAAAAAPWVLWGAYELIDRVRMLKTHDPQTDYMERDLRKEAVDRMARGMDFPAEFLMGLSAANHWAAKQIIDSMWRDHGVGIADQFVGDINDAYLRPGLIEANYQGWENVVVCYDESSIVVPADQTQDADEAYDRGEISGVGYRKLKNIPEIYKPSQKERDERLGKTGSDAPATRDPNVSDGPPPPGPEGDSGRKTRVVASALELGAAEMALARCRELAGIRIRQKEKTCPEFFVSVNGETNDSLAAAIGPEILDRISLTAWDLVRGGADAMKVVFDGWGYTSEQTKMISDAVKSYAARTLFKPEHPTLPSGFAAQFQRAKEASNVSD